MLAATDALNRQRLSPATEDVFGRPLDAQADLPSISWEDDYAHRANPALFTELLTQAVPALRSAEWRLLETAEGYAQSVLPLIEATTNHQGTHQAALMMLAADYTGGVALATLFRGFPVVGVHSPEPDWSADRAAMWLAKAEIKYTAPSTADVIVTCRVSTELIDQARLRFIQGEAVLLPLVVVLESEEATVATATMTYFARRSSFLRPRERTDRPNGLFQHQLKASARLVAGLRALNGSIAASPIDDPFSATVAGAHGRLLADMVTRVLPELPVLVASRTRDADDTLLAALESGVRQVVFIGVGLDCRPFRLLADCRNVTVFELDLPAMLQERERSLASLPQAPRVERLQIPIDLRHADVAAELSMSLRFDPELPTLFIFEGVSMYVAELDNQRILRSLARVMKHRQSRVWLDAVSGSVVRGTSGHSAVTGFVSRMARLGEPFVFGLDTPESFFGATDLRIIRSASASAYSPDQSNPIFDLYRFYVAGPMIGCAPN